MLETNEFQKAGLRALAGGANERGRMSRNGDKLVHAITLFVRSASVTN
jgi:hypothetical protein